MNNAASRSAYKKKYILYALAPLCTGLIESLSPITFFKIKAHSSVFLPSLKRLQSDSEWIAYVIEGIGVEEELFNRKGILTRPGKVQLMILPDGMILPQ